MMIFKRKGSVLLVSLGVTLLTGIAALSFINAGSAARKAVTRNSDEAGLLVTAHGVAALFKQELANNYATFSSAPCSGAASYSGFLNILQNGQCSGTAFTLSYFKTAAGANTVGYDALKSTVLVPIVPTNALETTLQFTWFNSAARSTANATITVTRNSSQAVGAITRVQKQFQMVIDLSRTVPPAPHDPFCHICPTMPGSVCCVPDQQSFMDSSGNIYSLIYDEPTGVLTISPLAGEPQYMGAVSAKNVGGPTTVYYNRSFKAPCVSTTDPAWYVLDTAQDATGTDYFLSVHGNFFTCNGSSVNILSNNPTIASFAYLSNAWYLLRWDGTVLRSLTDLTTVGSSNPPPALPGFVIPTAIALTSGMGTTNIFP